MSCSRLEAGIAFCRPPLFSLYGAANQVVACCSSQKAPPSIGILSSTEAPQTEVGHAVHKDASHTENGEKKVPWWEAQHGHASHHADAGEEHGHATHPEAEHGHAEHPEAEEDWGSTFEEETEKVDLAVAVMLLGSVAVVMSLFYLVNHQDDDMRQYSWSVISSTIAIFTAVLMFEAINGIINKLMEIHGLHIGTSLVVMRYLMVFVWFVFLQVVLAHIAHFNEIQGGNPGDDPSQKRKDNAEVLLQMKCWGTLLAHITGFAAVHAGGELQHLDCFSGSPSVALLPVFVSFGLLSIFFCISDAIRHRFVSNERVDMWNEITEEAENDIAALGLSFLCGQVMRFQFGHNLPNVKGLEPHSVIHDSTYIYSLLGCSAGCAVLSVIILLASGGIRRLLVCQQVAGFTFAWCMFYASKEAIAQGVWNMADQTGEPHLDKNSVCMRVILACLLSCFALLIIFVLDFFEDMDATGEAADKAIKNIINAIGILVGFSWEQAFEGGVEIIAETTRQRGPWYPIMTNFLLAITLAGGIIPAWRVYILKNTGFNPHVEEAKVARRTHRKLTRGTRKGTLSRMSSSFSLAGSALVHSASMQSFAPSRGPSISMGPSLSRGDPSYQRNFGVTFTENNYVAVPTDQ